MKRNLLIMMLGFIVFLTACSSEKDTKTNTPGKSGIAPLTGEKTSDAGARPVAVMVNNHTKARPQTGLNQADVTFEILAEGNITRFLAIYQSEKPKEVGPVRSAREYYFKLADGYDAIYVYHGAAKFVDKMILDEDIDFINGANHDNDGKLFIRSTDRQAPHNSYVQFGAIRDAAKEKGYDLTTSKKPLPFLEKEDEPDGYATSSVKITYSDNDAYNSEFKYHANDKEYTRDGTEDKKTGEPVSVANLLVIEAPHEVFDDEGRRKIDIEAGGTGYLFQEGKQRRVHWENEDGRIIATKNGAEIGFVPGKTWISIVPDNPGIDSAIEAVNE